MMSSEIWELVLRCENFILWFSRLTRLNEFEKSFFMIHLFSSPTLPPSCSQVIFLLGSDGLRASSEVHWGLNWAVKIKGSVSLTHTHLHTYSTHTSGTGTSWKKFLHKSWHEVSQANLSEKHRGWEKEKARQRKPQTEELRGWWWFLTG